MKTSIIFFQRIILVGGQTAYLNYSRSKKSEQLVFGDWYCNEVTNCLIEVEND